MILKTKDMRKLSKEQRLHRDICSYISWQYPKALFNSDLSGDNKSIVVAAFNKNLRSDRGYPDLTIYEPKGMFHGLLIELKADGSSPYKKNGEIKSNKHVIEQARMIELLKQRGYHAQFCTGFREAKECIDKYMNM